MICIICCEESQRVDLKKCDCQVCSGCLILYIKTSNENINFDSHITCPGECGSIYKIDELILYQELQRDLNIVLLLKYLQTEKDIRACPKNNCGNFGIMPNNKCNSQLMCNTCQYSWEAPELYTTKKKIIVSIVNYKQTTHFFLNQVSSIFLTKQCPKCYIPILKDGGCNHMTCRQCHFEFCWQCKQDHYDHKKYQCITHRLIRSSIILNFLVNFLFLMDIDDLLIEYFIGFSEFSINFIFSNTLITYVVYFFFELNKRRRIESELNEYYPYSTSMRQEMLQQINQGIRDCIIGLLIILLLFIIGFNGSIIDLLIFILKETLMITMACLVFSCSKNFLINLLRKTIKYFR